MDRNKYLIILVISFLNLILVLTLLKYSSHNFHYFNGYGESPNGLDYQSLKSKSSSEIKDIFSKISSCNKKFQYLLNGDFEEYYYHNNQFDEYLLKNDEIYPMVHHFKTRFGNLPYHHAEINAKLSIHKNAILHQHWYDIPHLNSTNLSSLRSKRELQNLRGIAPLDYAVVEYTGIESSKVLVSVIRALSPNIKRSLIIIGNESYMDELDQVMDEFLQSNKIFQVAKNTLLPLAGNETNRYITLMKLEKYIQDTPTYQLYNHLDKIHWIQDSGCNNQKYLIFNMGNSFKDIVTKIPKAISLSILLDRNLYLINNPDWSLFLDFTSCSPKYFTANLNYSNTVVYYSGLDTEEYNDVQYLYYQYSNEYEIEVLMDVMYKKFGFSTLFEYESAVLNWVLRLSSIGRREYRSLSHQLYNGNNQNINNIAPNCISMNIKNSNEIHKYLKAVKSIRSVSKEFSSLPNNVILMTDDSSVLDRVRKYENCSQGNGLKFYYFNMTTKLNNHKADLERILIKITEITESAQCEVMIGTTLSYLDRYILQVSISKFRNPVFFYSLDNSKITDKE